jgi:hypothetical protein
MASPRRSLSDDGRHSHPGDRADTQVIWDGIQSSTAPNGSDFGVYAIALIN